MIPFYQLKLLDRHSGNMVCDMMSTIAGTELHRLLPPLLRHLPPVDAERVATLGDLVDAAGQADLRIALGTLFEGVPPSAALSALERLAARFNICSEAARCFLRLHLEVTSPAPDIRGSYWFADAAASDCVTKELDTVGSKLIEGQRGRPLNEERLVLHRGEDGRPIVRWFLSYAREDRREKDSLLQRLQVRLANSKNYNFQHWHDGMVAVGANWQTELQQALQESQLGILFLSPAFLASQFILEHELPAFVRGDGHGVEGKRVVPVLLKDVDFAHSTLKGLGKHQIFRDHSEKSFAARTRLRDMWTDELVRRLHEMLDAYADVTVSPAGTVDRERERPNLTFSAQNHYYAELSDCDLDAVPYLVSDTQGQPTDGRADRLASPEPPSFRDEDVLDYMLAWLSEPAAPALFALLGDCGMGKTITCQRLAKQVEDERRAGRPDLPRPMYVDLRLLSSLLTRSAPPTLPRILEECLARGCLLDVSDAPTAQQIIEAVRCHPTLFIFDGLDEVLVHLSEADGRLFTRELLRLVPPTQQRRREATACHRVVVSCRGHCFRSLQAQNNHFTANGRDALRPSDFRALVLSPFTPEQVRAYLAAAVPEMDPRAIERLVESVHNLSELSRRPMTLRLIAELVPELERLRQQGKPIRGAALYSRLVERWLQRDEGKHHLKPEHKQRLMAWVACKLLSSGKATVHHGELDRWLGCWLQELPEVSSRYHSIGRDKLEEDLRTATLLVRDDRDPSTHGFRFAHTSLQEYFLARALLTGLREGRRECWALPELPLATLTFLGDMLQEPEHAALLNALGAWKTPYTRGASERMLQYALFARDYGTPCPPLTGFDLRGAQLRGWHFSADAEPLNLASSEFCGADLRETVWNRVRLDGARFDDAALQRALFVDSVGPETSFARTSCEGARFQRCELRGSLWSQASIDRAVAVQCAGVDWTTARGAARFDSSAKRNLSAAAIRRINPSLGHAAGVTACAFSPDGRWAVSGSDDRTLKLWEVTTGECLHTWTGHGRTVTACAFFPDGSQILSASDDRSLRTWSLATSECSAVLRGHTGWVRACAVSPDGQHIVSAGFDRVLRIWDAGGAWIGSLKGHEHWIRSCAFSADGRHVVSGGDDRSIRLWNIADQKCVGVLRGHAQSVTSCSFSPDGHRIVTASIDRELRLWEVATKQCIGVLNGHQRGINSCAFSPDGRLIASVGFDKVVRIWDSRTGTCVMTTRSVGGSIAACAFSPDGTRLLSASSDRSLRLWHRDDPEPIATWGGQHEGITACIFSSPDIVMVGTEQALQSWNTATAAVRRTPEPSRIASLDRPPKTGSQPILYAAGNDLRLLDGPLVRPVAQWRGHNRTVNDCALSPCGTLAISASDDHSLKLWNVASGTCISTWKDHSAPVASCAFSPDGTRVVSAGYDHTLRIWDVRTSACLATWSGHTSPISSCAFSPDGHFIISGGFDAMVRIWDALAGTEVAALAGHQAAISTCVVSPDGKLVASSSFDNTVRLWSLPDRRALTVLQGHRAPVTGCSFSPDGRKIVSGALDGSALLWEVGVDAFTQALQLNQGEHAVWNLKPGCVLAASPNAWRWLRWQACNAQGRLLDVLPLEAFSNAASDGAAQVRKRQTSK